MDRGFMTIAFGEFHLEWAILQSRMLSKVSDLPRAIVTDREPPDGIFSHVILTKPRNDLPIHSQRSEFCRLTPFRTTMFLESDVLPHQEIESFFSHYEGSPVFPRSCMNSDWVESDEWNNPRRPWVSRLGIPGVYTGMFIFGEDFEIFRLAGRLLNDWDDVVKRLGISAERSDDVSFSLASSSVDAHLLPASAFGFYHVVPEMGYDEEEDRFMVVKDRLVAGGVLSCYPVHWVPKNRRWLFDERLDKG